nr:hypothetical protein [Tanacetum cinerariifolium]
MSDASSAVTYTSVYTDFEPWRYYEEESAKTGSLRVIVYGYDGLPMQQVAPPSPDYVPGPEHPSSPNYEPFEDEDDDEEEEEEHLALADSSVVPIVDPVPPTSDTEAFETNESAPTPRAPHIIIPFSQTCLRRARKTVRLEPPIFKVRESFVAGAARQPWPTPESDFRQHRVEQTGYGITNTWDEIVDTLIEIAPTTLEGVNQRVTELDTTVRKRIDKFE